MLKKLKHKFILINMLMVGVVVIFIFTAVCILTYRSEKNEIKRSLEQVISLKGKDEIHIGGGAPEIGGSMPLPYVYAFSVLVNEKGEITGRYETGTDMDEEVLASAVGLVMDSDDQSGTIRSLALIYMKKNIPNGTVIAFASLEPLKITMKNDFHCRMPCQSFDFFVCQQCFGRICHKADCGGVAAAETVCGRRIA